MSWNIELNSSSSSIIITVCDSDGAGVSGLVAATLPDIYWSAPNADKVAISLSDLGTADAAWSAGGVFEKGSGEYRLDLPDALSSGVAAGSRKVFGSDGTNTVIPADINLVVTQLYPDNFAAFSINGFGQVTVGGYAIGQAPPTTAEILTEFGTTGGLDSQLDAILAACDDWTDDERAAIRTILGVPASGDTPETPADGVLADILAKTKLIGAGRIQNVSPVANNGGLDRLVRGDDYSGTTVQTLTYVDLDDSWPTLTGWTVEYQLRSAEDGPTVLAKAGTVTIATGSGKTITVELTGAETAVLTQEGYRRSIVATHTSSGVERTLVRGFAEVQSR